MNVPVWHFFIQYSLLLFVIVGGILLLAMSIIRPNLDMIKKNFFLFMFETLLVAALPAVPILFFVVSRGISMRLALQWFYALAIKFGIFHVLFQTSGFYEFLFYTPIAA